MFYVFIFFLFAFIIVFECSIVFTVWSHQSCFIPGSPLSQCLECLTQTTNALNSKAFKISNISSSKNSKALKNNEIKAVGKNPGLGWSGARVCQSVVRQDHRGGQWDIDVPDCGWTAILSPKFRSIAWKYYNSNYLRMAWEMKSDVGHCFEYVRIYQINFLP